MSTGQNESSLELPVKQRNPRVDEFLSTRESAAVTATFLFAYSMAPDSSPGYNLQPAARRQADFWKLPDGVKTLDGVQWEGADADGLNKNARYLCPTAHVICPPRFTASDIPSPEKFLEYLSRDSRGAILMNSLRQQSEMLGHSEWREPLLDSHRLAAHLNGLARDREWYVRFNELPGFQLTDLHRGELGTEHRVMPKGPGPLGRFQAQRVNRLIIESVCPDETLLKRFVYITTNNGLDHLLAAARSEQREIEHVILYTHPAHYPRARWQFLERAWGAGWDISATEVYEGAPNDGSWDPLWWPQAAQSWCRSYEAWLAYEAVGRRRLHL
jgi:hypothetical protein